MRTQVCPLPGRNGCAAAHRPATTSCIRSPRLEERSQDWDRSRVVVGPGLALRDHGRFERMYSFDYERPRKAGSKGLQARSVLLTPVNMAE